MIELMLALIIVAALVPILYDSLRIGFREKAAAELAVEPIRNAGLAMDWIDQDLRDATPPSASTSNTHQSVMGTFEDTDGKDERGCDADDLQFYSLAESPLHDTNNGEVKFIELGVVTTQNGDHVLVRKVTRDLLSDQAPNPDVEVIARGIGGFNLRYFDGTSWTDTWDSTAEDNTLPAAVEVTLTLDRPNGPSQNSDGQSAYRFVRVFQLPCSTAAFDSNVNSGGVQ